jgi:hypothetical protein
MWDGMGCPISCPLLGLFRGLFSALSASHALRLRDWLVLAADDRKRRRQRRLVQAQTGVIVALSEEVGR